MKLFQVLGRFIVNAEVFVRRKIRKCFIATDIKCLRNKKFVIISNNCFGGQAYQWLKLPYNTPFIGMFMYGPCYLKMLKNFLYYIKQDLVFVDESVYKDRDKTYPVARLDDVELHFSHYKSEDEAKEKWNRRRERLLEEFDLDSIFFVICDRERVDDKIIKEFHLLKFKNKLSFAAKEIKGLSPFEHISVYKDFNQSKRQTPNGKKMFKISFLYFDFVNWVNDGEVKRTRFKG